MLAWSMPKSQTAKSDKCVSRKLRNIDVRCREYLLEDEVEALIKAARTNRHGLRDSTMILVGYRHGLRVGEIISLRWAQVDWRDRLLHMRRLKNGVDTVHPLAEREIRALKQLQGEMSDLGRFPFVFASERKSRLTARAVQLMVAKVGEKAELPFPVHPHMLRHGCGYYLANHGYDTRLIQDYLGHREIKHTVIYTTLAPGRFNQLWSD